MTVCLKVYLLDSTLAFDMLYTYLADEAAPGNGRRFGRGMFVIVPFGRGDKPREAVVWSVCSPDEVNSGCSGDSGPGIVPAFTPASGLASATAKPRKTIVYKEIIRVCDDEPLSDNELELCAGLCRLYACTPGTAIRCIRPFREKKRASSRTVEVAELAIPAEEARRIISETKLRNIYQIKILEELTGTGPEKSSESCGREEPAGPEKSPDGRSDISPAAGPADFRADCPAREDADRLLLKTGAKRQHISALVSKGYIRLTQREAGAEDIAPAANTAQGQFLETYSEHRLNPEQEKAYEAVRESIDLGRPETFLLHGVTGSGKTEVYMHLISHVLAAGGDVIMMVPEIALTPQMISHFTSRFGDNVAVWHSSLTDSMREREWYRMKKSIARVAVCTRSGIFVPLKNVKLVIIDEAHDGSYRSEETGLRYDTCEVAELRFGRTAPVLYGSATPDVTMYRRAELGEITLLTLEHRAGAGSLPEMRIVDMRDERSALAYGSVISSQLKAALRENYEAGNQSMLFVGRRGFSSRMFCRDCGRTMICASCGLPMTFHRGAKRLLCNYCGRTAPAPSNCPVCGSDILGFGSAGTERVESELKELFPDAPVLRMDSDTVRGRDGHGALLRRFQKEKIPFLVGTQMITKGHDFPGVTLVGIIDADGQINQPEYDAGEKAYQVIAQVSGRAGRGSSPGTVLIQTYSVDDASIHAAVSGDYCEFYRKELAFRRAMVYPPFCSLCSIRVSGKDDRTVYDYLCTLAASMRGTGDRDAFRGTGDRDRFHRDRFQGDRFQGPVLILGPSREAVPKIGDRYRWKLTVKAADRQQIIELFLSRYDKIKPGRDMRLATVFEN